MPPETIVCHVKMMHEAAPKTDDELEEEPAPVEGEPELIRKAKESEDEDKKKSKK